MSAIFEFLFKYPAILYEEGEIGFLSPWPLSWTLALAVLLAIFALLSYHRARGRSRPRDRLLLGAIRGALLALLFLVLMHPALVLTTVVPERNFVAVLVDDSRSMTIRDADGQTRAERTVALADPAGDLVAALEEDFVVRHFRFSSSLERMEGMEGLAFDGGHTRIGQALTGVAGELQGVPLSGIVLISDGGDNAEATLGESLLPLAAASVPVFTVGMGDEELEADVQVTRADVPASVLAGSSTVVNVVVDAQGYAGRAAQIVVEDMGRIVATEDVQLPRGGQPLVVPIAVALERAGARELTVRIPGQPGERVLENNELHAVVQVGDHTEKILYFEGEPRHEVAFMLRAVAEDENLQVVLLQRTAENKFFRRNLDDPLELLAGFPTTREELFRYRALVLGSVEASFFTHDQLDMIADFVSVRGGTLLVLGGRRSLAEGGYRGTPLDDVLPVVLEEPTLGTPTDRLVFVRVVPTRVGAQHPAARIAGSVAQSLARWDSLPPVSTTNTVTALKSGATELLQGEVVQGASAANAGDRVVLAYQRYGKGRSMVLAVQDTWLWQMDHSVALEDESHETFWRQLLRWLVAQTPGRVAARTSPESLEAGERVTVAATVLDGGFGEVNGADVAARVTTPTGEVIALPMEWTVAQDGEYAAEFVPEIDGLYEVAVEAMLDTLALGAAQTSVRVAPGVAEFRDPHQRRGLLERIADETGGRYYSAGRAGELARDLQVKGGGVTVMEELDLWDMPALFLLLVALLATEWGYRRMRALA